MGIIKNNKNVVALYRGVSPIGKVYRGEVLVFSKEREKPNVFSTYWETVDGSPLEVYINRNSSTKSITKNPYIIDDTVSYYGGISSGRYVGMFSYYCKLKSFVLRDLSFSGNSFCGSFLSSQRDLISVDLSGWTISGQFMANNYNGYSYVGFFNGCKLLKTVNLSNWDLSNCDSVSLKLMFSNCSSLTDLNINGWNISNLTEMEGTFNYCTSLTKIDLSGWDTSNVTNINNLFTGCTSLKSVNLSGWDITKITKWHNIFLNCDMLTELDCSGWHSDGYVTYSGSSLVIPTNLKRIKVEGANDRAINFLKTWTYISTKLDWVLDKGYLTNPKYIVAG